MTLASPRGLACAVAVAALSAAPSAHAQAPASAALSWTRLPGAESCTSGQALARLLEQRAGHPLFTSVTRASSFVEGHVAAADQGWKATFHASDASGHLIGERTLESPDASCSSLDEPLLLVLSMMLEPTSPRPAPPTPPPSASALPPSAPLFPVRWSFDAAVTVLWRTLPDLTPGLSLRAEARTARGWGAMLAGTLLRSTEIVAAQAGSRVSLTQAFLGLCPSSLERDRWSLALCLGPGLASWSTEGLGLAQPHRDSTLLAQGFLAGQAHLDLTSWLEASLALATEVGARPSISYQAPDGTRPSLYRPPLVGMSGALGLGLHWTR